MTELSSGFNSIGFVASDQVKTIELSWSSSVLHLETTSRMFKVFQSYPECMFFVWLFIVGLWQMWWFGNFGAKKTKNPATERRSMATSYPTHLTRLEEQIKTLPYLPYIGMTLKLCTCRLFTRTTCSLLLPGLELNMTFPFPPYKVCPFHGDIKTSLTVKSMGWNVANLSVTAPNRTSSTLKMSPSCQGVLHHLNRPTMMSVYMDPSNGWNRRSELWEQMPLSTFSGTPNCV